jgi:hypothetical protein
MMSWLQPIILWAALPLAILLTAATIDALVTISRTSNDKLIRTDSL